MILNEICIYNNKIFVVVDTYLKAYSYRKHPTSQKTQNENFHECLNIKIPLKCANLQDIRLKVINNYVTGLKSLIILAFDYKGLNSVFVFSDAFRTKIYQILLPDWSASIENYLLNVFVTDGPTLLVHSKCTFHLYSVSCGVTNTFDYLHLCSGSKDYKIIQFQSFKPFYKDSCQGLLSLLVISCNYSSQQSLKFVGFISERNNPVIKCEQLHVDFFFPQCYESILKSVQVTKVVPRFKSKSSCLENIEKLDSVSVICTRTDCLVFTNAVLTYCCRLTVPLMDVMCMRAEFSSSTFSENRNLVLAFENMTVLFMAMTKSINCEVVKHWTDMEVVVIGDVLRKGSKQVLLMKQFDVILWQNNCILYEMLSFIPIDLLCHDAMPDICLKTTIAGLEKKVQVGMTAIKETEHEISEKCAATIDALMKLSEFRVNTEYLKTSNVFQESLVNLILSKDENKTECIPLEYEPCIKLLEEEQRFVDNQGIIRLTFINEEERCICNPSIKVLRRSNEVACIQKLFVYSSNASLPCNEGNRQISPKVKFCVVLCFDFSIIHAEEEISMILTWYSGSEEEFNNEVFITEEKKKLIQHQRCLLSKISLTDILNYKIKTGISSPDDILFTRASQQRMNLSLSSLHSNIRSEDMLLKIKFDSKALHLFESPFGKYAAFNEKSILHGTHLFLRKSRHNVVEIEAFTRNEKEICRLVHYLYQHLPEDVIILPCLKFKDEFSSLKRSVVTAMKNETDLLISSFNIHNVLEELRENYPKLMALQNAGNLSIPKSTYRRIRTVLVKKECNTDTIFKYVSADVV